MSRPPTRPRVLISAFSCNPERGSEPGVGHFFVNALAKRCDLTVITEAVENRAAIERRQLEDPNYAAIDFRFVPWPELDAAGKRIDDNGARHFYRCLRTWEQSAFKLAREITEARRYDLVHHLTMQGYREPGYLWKLPLPFIWGPVGGHAQIPWRYFPILGRRGCIQQAIRNVGNTLQAHLHPRVRRAARAAAAIVTNTSAEGQAFQRLHGVKATTIAEFGADEIELPARPITRGKTLKIAWSGVHLPRKALPILLHAIARLPRGIEVEAHILSDGPETGRWKELAETLGVGNRCTWHGRLRRSDAMAVMAACDLFALTSLLDGTSCVLNEAIALGLPVICHRACGFADIVDESCGMLVPLRSPKQSIAAFALAITSLAQDAQSLARLAAGARERSKQIGASQRAAQMLDVYRRVLNARNETPTATTPPANIEGLKLLPA